MAIQRSLFPDAFEVQERALVALEAFDLAAARRAIEDARERDPGLPELPSWFEGIAWLHRELGDGPVSEECLAAAFALVHEERRAGRLSRAGAERIDQALARHALARAGTRAFLDADERLHRGALLSVLGRSEEALVLVRESLSENREGRADLWCALGDACHASERADEANAAYVRALLLDPDAADLDRLRHARLGAFLDELRARHPEPAARALLLVHAWLAGVLVIPPENAWLEQHLPRLRLATQLRSDASASVRARRFALLLYLEASRPPGDYDEGGRDEMQTLDEELFKRVLAHLGRLRARETRRLRW
jgi:tetratricopeptide (TPR) repeat protein